MPRVDLQCELIPQPFVASKSPDILQENARTALSLLGIKSGSRGFSLVCDETAWFATLDLISGLQPSLGYVGGYFTQEPDQKDFSFLTLEEMRESNDDHIARLSQHYLLSRTDSITTHGVLTFFHGLQKKQGLRPTVLRTCLWKWVGCWSALPLETEECRQSTLLSIVERAMPRSTVHCWAC